MPSYVVRGSSQLMCNKYEILSVRHITYGTLHYTLHSSPCHVVIWREIAGGYWISLLHVEVAESVDIDFKLLKGYKCTLKCVFFSYYRGYMWYWVIFLLFRRLRSIQHFSLRWWLLNFRTHPMWRIHWNSTMLIKAFFKLINLQDRSEVWQCSAMQRNTVYCKVLHHALNCKVFQC